MLMILVPFGDDRLTHKPTKTKRWTRQRVLISFSSYFSTVFCFIAVYSAMVFCMSLNYDSIECDFVMLFKIVLLSFLILVEISFLVCKKDVSKG